MNAALAKEHYTTKLDPVYIGTRFTAKLPQMIAAETTILFDMEAIEGLVRGTLSSITGGTAPTLVQMCQYQAASKEFYRCTQHWSGGSLCNSKMAEIITRWTARGLENAVLLQIAYEVFHWTPPGA